MAHGLSCDLLGPGLQPVSPALAGGFLTIEPPGKSPVCLFVCLFVFPLCSLPRRSFRDQFRRPSSPDLSATQ